MRIPDGELSISSTTTSSSETRVGSICPASDRRALFVLQHRGRTMIRHLLLGVFLFFLSALHVAAQSFVDVQTGTYPLILSAPHGGELEPDSLADRSCDGCVTVRDSRTREWALQLADAIETRTGKRPWVVVNLLHRVKLDANRDREEAADGDPYAEQAWEAYHAALEEASDNLGEHFGGGLLLDLHGHGHEVPRFELGYLISSARLREADSNLDVLANQSSIRNLVARSGTSLSVLLRGNEGLGEFLQRAGVPATPSAQDPAPAAGQSFFSGGYITARHGSRDGGVVDAVQLEAHRPGARDTDENISLLADVTAEAILGFMDTWYGHLTATATDRLPRPQRPCLGQQGEWLHLHANCPAEDIQVFDVLGRRVGVLPLEPGQRKLLPPIARGIYWARGKRTGETVSLIL